MDIFYSLLLLALFLMWISCSRISGLNHFLTYMRAHSKALSMILWAMFLGILVTYILYFTQLAQMHDIPDAVNSAVVSQRLGVNPYENNVVPRFEGRYSPNPSWTFGTYNYLPLDLMVYSGFHWLVGDLGMPGWFVATNLLFSAIAFFLLRELLQVSWRCYAPIAGIVMLFYSFDNASLTVLLIVASLYLYHNLKPRHQGLATVVMGLAVMTKVYAAIPFLVMVLYQLQVWWGARDWRGFARLSASVAASGVIAVALMLPFGIVDVIDASVLFHTSAAARVGTSTGGTLLSELPLSSAAFTVFSFVLVLAAMLASLRLKSINDRMMMVSFVFLLVVVKSSLALLILPGIFLPLKMMEKSGWAPRNRQRSVQEPPARESRRLGKSPAHPFSMGHKLLL